MAHRSGQSQGERKISDILDAAGLHYEIEYSFPDLATKKGVPLRFDFAVFDDDGEIWFLIEYQGEQHYEPVAKFNGRKGLARQKYNDKQKVIYCQTNGYPLVVIPYYDYPIMDYDYIMRRANDW